MKKFLAFRLSYAVFIMLINVKMPTSVGILTFMSRMNLVLSLVEHERSFITLGSGPRLNVGNADTVHFRTVFSITWGSKRS